MISTVAPLLTDLADLLGRVGPDRFDLPTPCTEYDVAELRRHVLGWQPVFAAAFTDPDGAAGRPDPEAYVAPSDPAEAAAQVRDSAERITAALGSGAADRPALFVGATLPGSIIVAMLVGELVVHGWDLARATGEPWSPPAEACTAAHEGLAPMLSPEYRGPGKTFGDEIAVPDGASELDRLLGFLGRDPAWKP